MLKFVRFAAATAVCGVMLAPLAVMADEFISLNVDNSLATPYAKKLDGTVKFYFGSAPHAAVTESYGFFVFREKAGLFKSDDAACNQVFIDALYDFQKRVKAKRRECRDQSPQLLQGA